VSALEQSVNPLYGHPLRVAPQRCNRRALPRYRKPLRSLYRTRSLRSSLLRVYELFHFQWLIVLKPWYRGVIPNLREPLLQIHIRATRSAASGRYAVALSTLHPEGHVCYNLETPHPAEGEVLRRDLPRTTPSLLLSPSSWYNPLEQLFHTRRRLDLEQVRTLRRLLTRRRGSPGSLGTFRTPPSLFLAPVSSAILPPRKVKS
jgi:hypothetical protein